MRARSFVLATLLGVLGALAPDQAQAGAAPAQKALQEEKDGRPEYNVVQNRFILKEGRFELTPMGGYVPNNPFVKRYTGAVLGAYHMSETFAVEGMIMYSPDLGENDLKGLTHTLVQIADQGGSGVGFQQPLDKMILGATFNARWAPVYGKINLIGEKVLNFDFYGTGGVGALAMNSYYARYDEDRIAQGLPPAALTELGNHPQFAVNLGLGVDFFFSSAVAVKLDARNLLYVAKAPQYDPTGDPNELPSRLYNNFVASVGVAVFFPGMKPRIENF